MLTGYARCAAPRLFALLVAAAWLPVLSAQTAEVLPAVDPMDPGTTIAAYEIRFSDRPGGTLEVFQLPTGATGAATYRASFHYRDNGRGPDLEEQLAKSADGAIEKFSIRGTTTFGSTVDESFETSDGRASWRNTADNGAADDAIGKFYLPAVLTPFALGELAAAALSHPADGVALLPQGRLKARVVASDRLPATGDVDLVALTGMGLGTDYLWLRRDRANSELPALAAIVEPGFSLLAKADHAAAVRLEAAKRAAQREELIEQRRAAVRELPGVTLIRRARVFDANSAALGPEQDVYLHRGRIAAIYPTGSAAQDAQHEIDGGGRVLLPGLFDMHVHYSASEGAMQLAAGVTSARDMGNVNADLADIIQRWRAGELVAPKITPLGFIEGKSPHSSNSDFVIGDLDEARAAIDWYAQRGYRQLKFYNSFPKDVIAPAIAYAHDLGLKVGGHVPAFMTASDVVDAGFDEISHINQVALNFLVDDATDTRTLARFTLPAERFGDVDLDGAEVSAFIAKLKAAGTVVDVTLATFEFLHVRDGEVSPLVAHVAARLPPSTLRQRSQSEMAIADDAAAARYQHSFDQLVAFAGRMYRAGIPIVAGTDEIAGFTLQRELALLVQAGLTPSQALQVATRDAARVAGVLQDRGTIEVGKAADLILVDGEPTRDIKDISRVALVLQDGVAIDPNALYASVGVAAGPPMPSIRELPTVKAPTEPASK